MYKGKPVVGPHIMNLLHEAFKGNKNKIKRDVVGIDKFYTRITKVNVPKSLVKNELFPKNLNDSADDSVTSQNESPKKEIDYPESPNSMDQRCGIRDWLRLK